MDRGPEVRYGDELVVQVERAGVARRLEMLEDVTHAAGGRVPRLALEEQERTVGLDDASWPEVFGRVIVE